MGRQIRPRDRFEVLKRDGFACQYCGGKAPEAKLVIDHVHPVAAGGGNDIGNLITACAECNSGKAARLVVSPQDGFNVRGIGLQPDGFYPSLFEAGHSYGGGGNYWTVRCIKCGDDTMNQIHDVKFITDEYRDRIVEISTECWGCCSTGILVVHAHKGVTMIQHRITGSNAPIE